MNYRHAYHAGNFADVLKHAVLALVIEHLKLKPAPFRVIDTHAGIGEYDLQGIEAGKTGESLAGIDRILRVAHPPAVAAILAPYLAALQPGLRDGAVRYYPGSPLIARRLLRPDDRLIVNELHPADAVELARLFARDAQVKVTSLDGWMALKAFLPPKERRGVILVDPPFEEAGEIDRLVIALQQAVRRFATGTIVLWHPIKDVAAAIAYERQIAALNIPKTLATELIVRDPARDTGLVGSGLIVVNPPFTLKDRLEVLLPFLGETLRQSASQWRCRWLTDTP